MKARPPEFQSLVGLDPRTREALKRVGNVSGVDMSSVLEPTGAQEAEATPKVMPSPPEQTAEAPLASPSAAAPETSSAQESASAEPHSRQTQPAAPTEVRPQPGESAGQKRQRKALVSSKTPMADVRYGIADAPWENLNELEMTLIEQVNFRIPRPLNLKLEWLTRHRPATNKTNFAVEVLERAADAEIARLKKK